MTWRIVVDSDLCQSHGVCEAEAPELFEVRRSSPVVIVDPTPADARRPQADAAVKYCPTHALSIVEPEIPSDRPVNPPSEETNQ